MYIVTRTFRDAKGIFKVGDRVEPADVRAFKSRLADKHIINIATCDRDFWSEYFKNRYGIDLPTDAGIESATSSSNELTVGTLEGTPESTPELKAATDTTVGSLGSW